MGWICQWGADFGRDENEGVNIYVGKSEPRLITGRPKFQHVKNVLNGRISYLRKARSATGTGRGGAVPGEAKK
jgi:hypothetical protein